MTTFTPPQASALPRRGSHPWPKLGGWSRPGRHRGVIAVTAVGTAVGAIAVVAGPQLPRIFSSATHPMTPGSVVSPASAPLPATCAPALAALGDFSKETPRTEFELWASTMSTCGTIPSTMFARETLPPSTKAPRNYGDLVGPDTRTVVGRITDDGGWNGLSHPQALFALFTIEPAVPGQQPITVRLRVPTEIKAPPNYGPDGLVVQHYEARVLTEASGRAVVTLEKVDDRHYAPVWWSIATVGPGGILHTSVKFADLAPKPSVGDVLYVAQVAQTAASRSRPGLGLPTPGLTGP